MENVEFTLTSHQTVICVCVCVFFIMVNYQVFIMFLDAKEDALFILHH